MANSFTVHLPSNVYDYPNNQPNKFRVRLARPLNFTGNWVCGLHSIQYPYSWPATIGTLDEQAINIHFANPKGQERILHIPIPAGSHTNVEELAKMIADALDMQAEALGTAISQGFLPKPSIAEKREKRSVAPVDIIIPRPAERAAPPRAAERAPGPRPPKKAAPPREPGRIDNSVNPVDIIIPPSDNGKIESPVNTVIPQPQPPPPPTTINAEQDQKQIVAPVDVILAQQKQQEQQEKKVVDKEKGETISNDPVNIPVNIIIPGIDDGTDGGRSSNNNKNNQLPVNIIIPQPSEDEPAAKRPKWDPIEVLLGEMPSDSPGRKNLRQLFSVFFGPSDLSPEKVKLEEEEFDYERMKEMIKSLRIEYSKTYERFQATWPATTSISHLSFSHQIGYVLGWANRSMVQRNEVAKYGCDLKGGFSNFAVYVNGLTENLIIGNAFSHLLRVVSLSGAKPGEYNEKIYDSPIFARVMPKDVHDIEVELRTLDGRLLPFAYGSVMIVLLFKKVINF
jgi:hypothetical protein